MAWYRRISNLLHSDRLSRDINRELAFHISERVDELVACGMSEEEATRLAKRQFGNYTLQTERTRDMDIMTWLESLLADIRYGFRAMRRSPGMTSIAILSLALGIGANTAIFSLIDAVLLKSLPVSHPEQLLQVGIGRQTTVTNPIWEQLRDHQDMFSGAFAYSTTRFNITNGGESSNSFGAWVSGDFFSTLGIGSIIGRPLNSADDRRGGPAVAVLGYSFWKKAYGGDPGVLGKTIALDQHPFEIVGVAEPGFFGVDVGTSADIFAPLACEAIVDGKDNMLDHRSAWWVSIIGRVKPGVSREQVQARLAVLSPGIFAATLPPKWRAEDQQGYLKYSLTAQPAADGGFSRLRIQYRQPLIALMIVCAIVLLIACANVANLLLARGSARQREIGIRIALGSGRRRLIRQLLTESMLLSVAGAALGLLFAQWSGRLVVGFLSTSKEQRFLDLTLDARMLVFTTVVAIVTGILFGLLPAWRSVRVQPHLAMKSDRHGIAEGHSRFTLGKALVVIQVALSGVLVVGAGLMLETFRNLATLDPGFQRDHVLLVNLDLRSSQYTEGKRSAAYHDILTRLRAIPGAGSVSSSMITPVSQAGWDDEIIVDGYTPKSRDDADTLFNRVSDHYFATLGTPMLAGRDFNAQDTAESTRVAIVNEAMARKFFGTTSPLGKTFRAQAGPTPGPPTQIIGVVKDAKYRSLREDAQATAYVPASQDTNPETFISFELRSTGNPTDLIPGVKSSIAAITPAVNLDFVTLSAQLNDSLTQERLLATLSGFFGGLALLLAAMGLYGVMSYNVSRRRNEIGIRMALGAERSRLLAMILGEAGVLVAIGLVAGLGAAVATTRLAASFLYGLKPTDTATFALSAAVLSIVALIAGFLPARRASQVDPMTALRDE